MLPNGRLLPPRQFASDEMALGHPVDMVAHPKLPFVYVADARYLLNGDAERCPPLPTGDSCPPPGTHPPVVRSHRRGIHVISFEGATPVEVQDPSMMCINQAVTKPPGPACPGGTAGEPLVTFPPHIPYDGAFGLAIKGDGTTLYASTGISGYVLQFTIEAATGMLRLGKAIPVGGFTAGLALAPDEKSLFAVRFLGANAVAKSSVVEIALAPSVDNPDPSVGTEAGRRQHRTGRFRSLQLRCPSRRQLRRAALDLWIPRRQRADRRPEAPR